MHRRFVRDMRSQARRHGARGRGWEREFEGVLTRRLQEGALTGRFQEGVLTVRFQEREIVFTVSVDQRFNGVKSQVRGTGQMGCRIAPRWSDQCASLPVTVSAKMKTLALGVLGKRLVGTGHKGSSRQEEGTERSTKREARKRGRERGQGQKGTKRERRNGPKCGKKMLNFFVGQKRLKLSDFGRSNPIFVTYRLVLGLSGPLKMPKAKYRLIATFFLHSVCFVDHWSVVLS